MSDCPAVVEVTTDAGSFSSNQDSSIDHSIYLVKEIKLRIQNLEQLSSQIVGNEQSDTISVITPISPARNELLTTVSPSVATNSVYNIGSFNNSCQTLPGLPLISTPVITRCESDRVMDIKSRLRSLEKLSKSLPSRRFSTSTSSYSNNSSSTAGTISTPRARDPYNGYSNDQSRYSQQRAPPSLIDDTNHQLLETVKTKGTLTVKYCVDDTDNSALSQQSNLPLSKVQGATTTSTDKIAEVILKVSRELMILIFALGMAYILYLMNRDSNFIALEMQTNKFKVIEKALVIAQHQKNLQHAKKIQGPFRRFVMRVNNMNKTKYIS